MKRWCQRMYAWAIRAMALIGPVWSGWACVLLLFTNHTQNGPDLVHKVGECSHIYAYREGETHTCACDSPVQNLVVLWNTTTPKSIISNEKKRSNRGLDCTTIIYMYKFMRLVHYSLIVDGGKCISWHSIIYSVVL